MDSLSESSAVLVLEQALTVHSILADEEVRQGLKVWVSHEQNDVEIVADIW